MNVNVNVNGSVPAIRQLPLDTFLADGILATVWRANFGFSTPGCVPRYEPSGPARIDLPRRRLRAVYRDLGRGVRQDGLAGSCLFPHAESFSASSAESVG